jgi:hypothetical protein
VFLTNVMPIVIDEFYKLIDQYTIRPTVCWECRSRNDKAKKKFWYRFEW